MGVLCSQSTVVPNTCSSSLCFKFFSIFPDLVVLLGVSSIYSNWLDTKANLSLALLNYIYPLLQFSNKAYLISKCWWEPSSLPLSPDKSVLFLIWMESCQMLSTNHSFQEFFHRVHNPWCVANGPCEQRKGHNSFLQQFLSPPS